MSRYSRVKNCKSPVICTIFPNFQPSLKQTITLLKSFLYLDTKDEEYFISLPACSINFSPF